MSDIDYAAPAELFSRGFHARAAPIGYKRFSSASRAIQFSIEEMGSGLLTSAVLEVGDDRFEGKQIRALYDDPAYPLPRAETADEARANKLVR